MRRLIKGGVYSKEVFDQVNMVIVRQKLYTDYGFAHIEAVNFGYGSRDNFYFHLVLAVLVV